MRTIDAVELFAILKDLKLSGLNTTDRLKIIKNLRALREVADKYNNDIELAKEHFKSEDYDDLVMSMLESNEAVAAGGDRTISDLGIASFNRMHEELNRSMRIFQVGIYDDEEKCFHGGLNDEPVEVTLETLTGSAFDKLLDANKDVPAGALAVLYDKMVK